jgi:formamidopyrimidine-DNA glycosylase
VPELPEVETIRSMLEPAVLGRRFACVRIEDPRLTRPLAPGGVAARLEGETVRSLERRGKYLAFRFASGRTLLIHLRMTGSLRHSGGEGRAELHDRAVIALDDGTELTYRDVRRFGTWLLLESGELEPYLEPRVGREPLEASFTAASLERRLAGRRAPIKSAILDQRTVAGLGNIYADEALWRARIHPLVPAGRLESEDVRRLHRALRGALRTDIVRPGCDPPRLPDSKWISAGQCKMSSRSTGVGGSLASGARLQSRRFKSAGAGGGSAPHVSPSGWTRA